MICCMLPALLFSNNSKWFVKLLLVLLPIVAGIYTTVNKKDFTDNTMGYKEAVDDIQHMCNYMVKNDMQNQKIYTSFLLRNALESHKAGYVSKKNEFHLFTENPLDAEIIIITYIERDMSDEEKDFSNKPVIYENDRIKILKD